MSLNHRPARTQVPAHRLHEGFRERLARGGQPLPVSPLQELLPRPRRFRPARFLYVARDILGQALFGCFLGLLAAVAVVGPVAHGLGWI